MADDPHDRLADMDPEKLETLIEHAETLEELAEAREDNSLSRREAVKLAGALGVGGLLGGGGAATAIDPARAQASTSDSYGDVGEPGDRVDVFADGVDTATLTDPDTGTTYDLGDDLAGTSGIFEDSDGDGVYEQSTGDGIDVPLVSTEEAHIGTDPQRPMVSEAARTITVGTDVNSIQEAFYAITALQLHQVTIDIPDGTYDEDPILSGSVGSTLDKTGDTIAISISGNGTTPSNVQIGSLQIDGVHAWVSVNGVEFTRDNPHTDEADAVGAYNSKHVTIRNINYRNSTRGVTAYNSNVELGQNNDFGESVLSGRGVVTKHGGLAWEQPSLDTISTGHVGGYGYRASQGRIVIDTESSSLTGTSGRVDPDSWGIVKDIHTGVNLGHPSPMGLGPASYSKVTTDADNSQTLASGETVTVFDVTSGNERGIIGGVINGYRAGYEVTFLNGSTESPTAGGDYVNTNGGASRVLPVLPFGPVTKLTITNNSGESQDYGWTIYSYNRA